MAARSRRDDVEITESSGSIYRDLKIPNGEERETKIRIAVALNMMLDRLGLTQKKIAARLGTDQPKVSALRKYKLDGFSVQRLMEFLTALDCDVEINIRPKRRARRTRPGTIQVKVHAA